ncbi:transposase [Methanophagales archaeon]|nr:MAG: transposase [Methanophagales archaeon]
MAVRSDKMGQSWLLPLDISELIPVDHICYLVIAIVNGIDVSEIEEKYRFKLCNSAYPRRMLLRLLVQAAIDGVWSSRKINKLAHESVVYMYLAGNEKPDFRTLCKFRSENKELIETTFEKNVTFTKARGILTLEHLSTNGTKMKANASNDYTLCKAEIEAIREIIEHGIAIDKEEDKLYGDKRGDELQKEQIIEKLDKAEEELNTSGQSAVSITDPEARFMKNKKERIELLYNPQITVDHD